MSANGLDMFIVVLSSSFGLIYEDHETPLIYDYHKSESETHPTTLVGSQWFLNLLSKPLLSRQPRLGLTKDSRTTYF